MHRLCLFGSLCLLGLIGCQQREARQQLKVYAAASLTDIITEVGDSFAEQNDIELVYNFASSGDLARQLIAKPQADVFISANTKWMNTLDDAGLILANTRSTLLSNRLVIVAHKNASYKLSNPNNLSKLPFAYCAIGDPAHVPIGQYAKEWLTAIDQWQALQSRISPAPNARAVLAQVSYRSDLIGIVYYSDFLTRQDTLQILYEVPISESPAIEYQVARIVSESENAHAAAFIEFLRSETTAAAFEAVGFSVVDAPIN